MGFFSILGSLFKPQTFKTGEKFENYVRKKLFTDRYYKQIQRTYGYNVKTNHFVQSADPDFKLYDRRRSKIFFAEIKYRKQFFKGKVNWCTENQLNHYRHCNYQAPVFIVLGVGGDPWKPESVFLIPLKLISYTELYLSEIKRYAVHPRRAIASRILWRR